MKRCAPASASIGLLVVLCAAASADPPDRLTVEWIHSDEAREAGRTPSYSFAGVSLLRYDSRLPEAERTVELIDRRTGAVTLRVDPEKAMANLSSLFDEPRGDGQEDKASEDEDEPEELGQPLAVTSDGRRGLYRRHGDLLLLDFATSSFSRLTETGESETSARLSPDDAKVAFVRDNDLYVVDVESQRERRLTRDGSETTLNGTLSWVYWEELYGRRDRGYLFSPDSSRIAFLQFDDAAVDVMTFVDPKPDTTRLVRQRYPKAGAVNPRVRAGVVDLESGRTTWIDLGAFPYEYLVRLVWLPDSERLVVETLDRAQENLDLFLADAGTGRVRHLFRETDEAWVDVHDDLVFLADGERFLWVSSREGHSHLFLYELTADGASLVRPLTGGDWSVSGGARRGDGLGGAIAAVDENAGHVYFMGKRESHLENHLYRVGLDGRGLERLTPAAGSHSTTWSGDGRYYLDAHSSFDRPPSTELRRADGELARTLIEPSTELADHFGFHRPELLSIRADDGFELPALLLRPIGFDPAVRYPVIVNVYGGPAAPRVRNRWHGSLYDHLLSSEGFLQFTIDPRTSTAMGKPTTRRLLRDFYSEAEAADIVAGVRWLKEQPFVDAERVGVTGWSGGGTTTVSVMTRSQEFRAGIAGAGVYDWHLYDTIYTERYMKHPAANREAYEKDLAGDAQELTGRLLLMHGTYDDNVHPQNTWRLVDRLIDAGIVFDLAIYPMRKHGFGDRKARLHRDKTRLDFWRRELGDGG